MHGGDLYGKEITLDFSVNVNPFGIPKKVLEALHAGVEECTQYPDPFCRELKQKIAAFYGVDEGQIVVGNGASELFPAILRAVMPKRVVLTKPSFSGYEKACKAEGMAVKNILLEKKEDFCLKEELIETVCEGDLFLLAIPNNPNGGMPSGQFLQKLADRLAEKSGWLLLDACFWEFTKRGQEDLKLEAFRDRKNVLIVRAFTKTYAIPGIRLGFCTCRDLQLIRRIWEYLPEWNVSLPAQKAGVAALEETKYLRESVAYVQKEREYLVGELEKLGFRVYPGEGNFLLFFHEKNWYERMLQRGILIRDCSDYEGLGKGFYRIAVKKREENEMLLQIFRNERRNGG